MKKQILAGILSATMVVGMGGVSVFAADKADDKTYNIGICQLVQHEALDAATQGFKDAITEELGDKVTFDEQNAQGDSNTCSTIITDFVSKNVDLILANATPALQAASAGTSDIPILGTAVTEYGVALDLDDFDGTVGGNISGTSDLAPLEDQAAMLNELFPDAKNVGLIYCSAEANSQYQVDTVKAALEKLGYTSHKRVIIWRITEHNKFRTSKGILFFGCLCSFQDNLTHQFHRIHINTSLGRTNIYRAADTFCYCQSLWNGTDQKFFCRSHPLADKG